MTKAKLTQQVTNKKQTILFFLLALTRACVKESREIIIIMTVSALILNVCLKTMVSVYKIVKTT